MASIQALESSIQEPEEEFDDPRRLPLLQALSEALDGLDQVGSTVWAYLWICNVDKLQELVAMANAKVEGDVVELFFNGIETFIKPVQNCGFTVYIVRFC
jgi:hypothetical protein